MRPQAPLHTNPRSPEADPRTRGFSPGLRDRAEGTPALIPSQALDSDLSVRFPAPHVGRTSTQEPLLLPLELGPGGRCREPWFSHQTLHLVQTWSRPSCYQAA